MNNQVYFIANGFQALDLFGPLDAFMETNNIIEQAYCAKILGISRASVSTAYSQQVNVDLSLDDDFDIDDLIICGGSGMRTLVLNNTQRSKLLSIAQKAKRIFTICTGAFVLADIMPQNALTLTTHWRHCNELKQKHAHVKVDPNPLFINNENIWSSAGVLSGVDLALAVIRLDHGNAIASKVAKELVVYLQRAGCQNQYSDILQLQSGESLQLSPLIEWLNSKLSEPVCVTQMAEFIGLSERQLTRLFKRHLNTTPSAYFKQLKLNSARDLLGQENISLQVIAFKFGFSSYDSFRRAFQKQFGVSPSHFTQGNSV